MKLMNYKGNCKFSDILRMWLESKDDIKIQSYQRYDSLINKYINYQLGSIYINKINERNFVGFFKKLRDLNIAISTQKTILYIIKSSLEIAYNKGMCDYINFKNIKFKSTQKIISVFSKEEQNIIENKLKKDMNIRKLCLLLCLYTGLRIGEVSGLKWEDINFTTGSLEINRTIERIKNNNSLIKSKTILIESTPKSITSFRVIPIPEFLINTLKEFKSDDKYFILSNSEKLYDPRQFEAFYERIIRNCGVNYANFHTLRHTFATRSIESKMDIKTLSEILGHSSVEITLKLYVHPSYELKRNSIENLVQFMIN